MATEVAETEMANNGERNWPGLCELTSSLPKVALGREFFPIKGEMPKVIVVAEAFVRAAMRIEAHLSFVADVIAEPGGDFDFMPDDYLSEARAAAVGLDEARELLEEVKTAMLRWLRCINASAVVEMDSEAWAAVKTLRSRSPAHILVGHLVEVAVRHLAADKASDTIVAAHERARLEALDRERGDKAGVRERTHWPWTDQRERPWNDAGHTGNREQADAGRKPEDGAEDASVDTPSQGRVRDAESLICDDVMEHIARFRRYSGWGAGHDVVKLCVAIPELNKYGEITEDADTVYERSIVGPHGLIEKLIEGVDPLCDELDPGGIIELEDVDNDRDAGTETSRA